MTTKTKAKTDKTDKTPTEHLQPIALLFADLAKFQQAMTGAKKDAENPFHKSKYADLSSVVSAIKEGSQELNIGFYHKTHDQVLTTVLFYSDGVNYAEIESSLSIDVKVDKGNPMQAIGSAITYAKRYTLQGLYGLPSEDDDGNALQGATFQQPAPAQKQPFTMALLDNPKAMKLLEDLMKEHKNGLTAATAFTEKSAPKYTFTGADIKAIESVCNNLPPF